MKIIARQVDPAVQNNPFDEFDFDEIMSPHCAIFGNRDFVNHIPDDIKQVMDELDNAEYRYRHQEEAYAEDLTRRTGHAWKCKTIRGCCQGDWQYCLYDADYNTDENIERLETMYFNTGTEWVYDFIDDDEAAPDDPGDIWGTSIYCVGWNPEDIRREIADDQCCDPQDVTLYAFDGYTRHAKYKIA